MNTPWAKIAITTVIGIAVATLGAKLLLGQTKPIEPFDYFSFLTALAAFGFSLYQVVQESTAKDAQRRILLSLLESANANIARVHQFSLRQDPSKNVSELLVGVLQQEQVHIAGLLKSLHKTEASVVDTEPAISHEAVIELFDGHDEVRAALKDLTNQAKDFIYIVGGRSRDKEYLDCLLTRLRRGDLEHMRVVTGNHIRAPLYNHLVALEGLRTADESFRVQICYLEEDKYGSFTVTRDSVFWALPSSTETELTSGVRINSAKIASDLRAHVVALSAGQREPKDIEFFRTICREFWPNGIRPAANPPKAV